VAAREISIKLAEKKRERHRLVYFGGGRRRTVDIENGKFSLEKFEGDRREFKVLKVGQGGDFKITAESQRRK